MLVTSLNFTYIDPHNDKIELDSELCLTHRVKNAETSRGINMSGDPSSINAII